MIHGFFLLVETGIQSLQRIDWLAWANTLETELFFFLNLLYNSWLSEDNLNGIDEP